MNVYYFDLYAARASYKIITVCLSVHLSVNSFSENWLIRFFTHLMTGFQFFKKALIGPILRNYGQRWFKSNDLFRFFNSICTIILYVLFLTLYSMFFAILTQASST